MPSAAGTLSPECAALVALGDPRDVYAAYESALGTSALASKMKLIEKSFNMRVRALNPSGPEGAGPGSCEYPFVGV